MFTNKRHCQEDAVVESTSKRKTQKGLECFPNKHLNRGEEFLKKRMSLAVVRNVALDLQNVGKLGGEMGRIRNSDWMHLPN